MEGGGGGDEEGAGQRGTALAAEERGKYSISGRDVAVLPLVVGSAPGGRPSRPWGSALPLRAREGALRRARPLGAGIPCSPCIRISPCPSSPYAGAAHLKLADSHPTAWKAPLPPPLTLSVAS